VHDENARALGGVAGHAGLFSHARDVAEIVRSLLRVWHGQGELVATSTLREFWSPCRIPQSTWCLGWDRPSATASSAGSLWPRSGVGHLGFTGCSIWIDPPRARAVILLSNRVHPTRTNDAIRGFRPILHDAVVRALDQIPGDAPRQDG
jgi:CubicO group peptidase (beta-lactamase class C family)